MTKTSRRIILFILVAGFMVMAPLLMLYSMGYKYNWQRNAWEKTGVFYVKSFPRSSTIILNGKEHDKKTPTQITRLLPKTYDITITKEGYRPWHKNLAIYPQTTTFIEDVSLFYAEPKYKVITDANIQQLISSFDNSHLALLTEVQKEKVIYSYNTNNGQLEKLYEPLEESLLLGWSYTNNRLIIKEGDKLKIIDSRSKAVFNLADLTAVNISQLGWHPLNDNILYGLADEKLYLVNLLSLEINLLPINDPILKFYPSNNNLYYLTSDDENFVLKLYTGTQSESLFVLPESTGYELRSERESTLNIFDTDKNILYLADFQNEKTDLSALKNVHGYRWLNNSVVYWNFNEIWVYDISNGQKTLLERTSQQVNDAFWHANSDYIFGYVNNELKIYELDSRDQRNSYNLLSLTDQNQFLMSRKGNYIYLTNPANLPGGFYEVKIQ